MNNKAVLVTGCAKRIGAAIASHLHANGYNVIIHYRSSAELAENLCRNLTEIRPDSAITLSADLRDTDCIAKFCEQVTGAFGRLDALVNNASTFYPTPIELINEEYWQDLLNSNLKAPTFLVKYLVPELRSQQGSIVNITDIHAQRPMKRYPIYSAAKAGLEMLTKALARDLAPDIKVNGVAPGAILWPENESTEIKQQEVLRRIPMQRFGDVGEIAETVAFLIDGPRYITGQIINVDGGRSIAV